MTTPQNKNTCSWLHTQNKKHFPNNAIFINIVMASTKRYRYLYNVHTSMHFIDADK